MKYILISAVSNSRLIRNRKLDNSNQILTREQFKAQTHGTDLEFLDYLYDYFNNKHFNNQLDRPTIRWQRNTRNPLKFRQLGVWKYGKGIREISIAPRLINNEKELHTTLVHEMCHQAVTELDKVSSKSEGKQGHGPHWEKWMRHCGLDPDRYANQDRVMNIMDEKDKKILEERNKIINNRKQSFEEELTRRGLAAQNRDLESGDIVVINNNEGKLTVCAVICKNGRKFYALYDLTNLKSYFPKVDKNIILNALPEEKELAKNKINWEFIDKIKNFIAQKKLSDKNISDMKKLTKSRKHLSDIGFIEILDTAIYISKKNAKPFISLVLAELNLDSFVIVYLINKTDIEFTIAHTSELYVPLPTEVSKGNKLLSQLHKISTKVKTCIDDVLFKSPINFEVIDSY